MGILDDLKNKVEKLGDRAREGFDDAKDKAGDLLDDAKERLGQHGDERSPLSESSDVGPDSSSTDAVQPGYVTAEDDVTEDSDESALESQSEDLDDDPDAIEGADDAVAEEEVFSTEPAAPSDVVPPAAAELDPVDLDAEETHADELVAEPAVEKDVDPYDQPLTESIGDELANALVDPEAVAKAVETDRDAQA